MTSVKSRKRSATQRERWKGPDAQGCHPTYRDHITAAGKAQAAERKRLEQLGREAEARARGDPPPTGDPPPPPSGDPPPPPPHEDPAPGKPSGPRIGPRAWASRRARAS